MSRPSIIQRLRRRLPVRLKLAVVSAGLTFAILLLFAVVVGAVTERRLNTSFEDDLRGTAADLQDTVRVTRAGEPVFPTTQLAVARAGGAVIRIFNGDRQLVLGPVRPDLGPPIDNAVVEAEDYRVISRPLYLGALRRDEPQPFDPLAPPVGESIAGYVQYAKPQSELHQTIRRVRFFLAFGVLGGTALAFLAGFAVARRAMRPIADLTRAAREVGRTRDPSVSLPKPEARDEVHELAETLEEMLTELDAARAETESALLRQRAFVADASHELRTPLTSILANLELLEAELHDDQRDIAGSALRSSRRMSRLVADLLLLARADAGRRAPRKPVDLAEVVREAAAEASPMAGERTVELELPGNGAAMVHGAPDDLHRLVLNLIENALIHTPVDARVRAAVRPVDGGVELEVADDGPGIMPELRERVFDRFSRGGGDTTPAFSGSGLGLSIVRAVAAAHGGNVSLDEPPGGGARFTVLLPASVQAAAPADARTSA